VAEAAGNTAAGSVARGAAPASLGSRTFTGLLLGAAALFALLVGLELHGFSLPFWHFLVDDSPAPEVLAGRPREHRWDDFAVQLPFALGQAAHEPPFPVVNENIGLGQNMLVPTPLPVAHPATLFRPTMWGFFLGEDVGLSWMWWSQILGAFAVWLAVFHKLLRASLGLALGGCGLILFSPYFQFWSFNMAPAAIYMGLCALSLVGLARARGAGAILTRTLALGWAGGCFLLTLYPPYLVSLGFLFLVLAGGLLLEHGAEPRTAGRNGWRWAGLAVAAGCSALAIAVLLAGASDAIEVLRHTEYPGTRVCKGGERPFWWLVNANLGLPLQVGEMGWGALENVCEAASCWLVSPAIAGVVLWRWIRGAERPDPITAGLLAYCTIGLLYCHFEFGEPLARATLLSHVPSKRAVLGLALAEALLVVRFAAGRRGGAAPRGLRAGHTLIALAWALAVGACAVRLREALPELHPGWMAAAAALNGLAVYALAERWHARAVVGAVAAALSASTIWFNPLVRGGAGYLHENSVARHVVEIDRALGGRSAWAVYGHNALANLIVANGVRVLNGEQPIPQLALWKRLDPSSAQKEKYNRYANVFLTWPPPDGKTETVMLAGEASINVYFDPGGGMLRRMGPTHLLVTRSDGLAEFFGAYRPLAEVGRHAIFCLPLEKDSAR
jgi:hypothetical protein